MHGSSWETVRMPSIGYFSDVGFQISLSYIVFLLRWVYWDVHWKQYKCQMLCNLNRTFLLGSFVYFPFLVHFAKIFFFCLFNCIDFIYFKFWSTDFIISASDGMHCTICYLSSEDFFPGIWLFWCEFTLSLGKSAILRVGLIWKPRLQPVWLGIFKDMVNREAQV